jgi:hypothetical protein
MTQRDVRFPIMLSHEEARSIQDHQFAQRLGSRAEAARQLIAKGLEAAAAKGPAEAPTSPSHDHDQSPEQE